MVKAVSLLMATAQAVNPNSWWTGVTNNPPAPVAKSGQAAPLWLPWGAWSSCRGVCGSGVSNRLRRCLNGVAGVDCSGDSLDSRACDNPVDDTCSYWSGWGQWEAWGCESKPGTRLKRVKKRTCFGRNTDQCVGSTEIVEYENAPLQNYCLVDNQASCCPYNDLQCSTKRCYTQGQCQDPVLTSESNVPLPCCDEFDTWSVWLIDGSKSLTPTCNEQTATRTRTNLCTKVVETEYKTIPAIDGVYSQWDLVADCDGPKLEYGNNQIWQCAGKRVFRRSHSCYQEGVHTTDKYGNALEFTKTEPCGVDADPQWTAWSINDEECNARCANAGVVRDRQLYDFCKKTYIPCDVNDSRCRQPCGQVGNWHLWSAWSTCTNSCGGVETRFRKHECGLLVNGAITSEETENRVCGAEDGWGPWSSFDGVCDATYPAACTDKYITRTRTSACGVVNPLTNQREFTDTETLLCNKPPMTYVTQEGPCSADCHDTINNVFSYKVINTYDACGTLVDQKSEQCNKGPCCYALEWSAWSTCNCAGQATRSRKYFNGCMADDVQTQSCQAPSLPLRNWSAWTTCSGNCPAPKMRFRCPVCAAEDSDRTCKNTMTGFDQTPEIETEECPQVTAYKCDQCVGMCGRGQKKCYLEDQCTLTIVPGTEQMVNCDNEIAMPADNTPVEGACMHIAGNPLCPGTKNIHKPVHQCYQAKSWTVACGPTDIPADEVSQWSACDPATCTQTRIISNVCTGLSKVETQACEMPRNWSAFGECMSDDANAPRYWYNNEMLPCSGFRKSVLPPVCPGQIAQERFVACGLELELDSLDNLNSQTCLDNVAHYIDCARDDKMNCIFPEAKTLSCDTKTFVETVSIVRTPLCPKWSAVRCSKNINLDPETCDPCKDSTVAPGPWSKCSEECKLGYQIREIIQTCPNSFLPGPAFTQPTGQREVIQCGPTPQVVVTEGECVNKNGACTACSNTGSGTKTVTHTQIIADKPQCGSQIIKVEEVPCQLPLCPQWQEQIFPTCGMCDISVSRTRQCIKPLGAEMCDCIDTPFEDTQLCPATTNWSEWSDFDLCSRSCGGGEKTRTRYNLCDMNQVETNTVECNTDPGTFVDTGNRTPCSSNRCVEGTNSPILTHTCERDANNNPVTILGQPSVCFTPLQPATTKTAVGGCMAAVDVPAAACTRGLQKFIVKNECAAFANVNPAFADQIVYEYCDVPAVEPTEWTPFTACTKQCINAGEAAEVQTSQRLDECGNVEIRQQLCSVPSCASWQGWIVKAKCSCLNPGAAVVERQCLDGYGQPAVGCVGESTYQVPCGPNTSAQAVNPSTFGLPLLTEAQLAEIKSALLDLGSWTQNAGQWSAYSGCAKTCDVTGVCGQESRYIESFCTDADGNRVSIDTRTETRDCPCETGVWQIVADTCSSSDPMTCSGVRTVTKRHTCTGDQVTEQAGSCGTPGTWGAWSAYTQCRTSCSEAVTPTRSRTRSWTCAAERLNGMYADETEIVACPSLVCAYFGAWSAWSACTVSCGMGQKTRTRYCHGGAVGTGLCIGDESKVLGDETVACDMGDCCEWDWSGWTGCCRGADSKNKRLRLRGNNCGQDVEQIEKPCELDYTNPSATYASCSIIRQTGVNLVRQGESLTWMATDSAASIMDVINPDNVQNVVYNDFKAEENPLTHEIISDAEVVAAPVQVQPQVINQTIMPGQQIPMFQAPFTQNMQIQQQQPVLVQQVNANQQPTIQEPMFQPQMVQQAMAQPQMVHQAMVQPQMVQEPMVQHQAPVVEETSPNTSPFGAFDFLFSRN